MQDVREREGTGDLRADPPQDYICIIYISSTRERTGPPRKRLCSCAGGRGAGGGGTSAAPSAVPPPCARKSCAGAHGTLGPARSAAACTRGALRKWAGRTRPGPPREAQEESVPPQDGVHRGVHGALRDECEAQGLRVNLAGPTALIQSTRAIKSTSECMAAPSQTPDESKRRLRRLSRLLRSRGNPQCMGNPSAHARTPRQAHALPRRAPLAAPLANRPRRALRE